MFYNFGLHRDDGLGITIASPRQSEKIKKNLCDIFGKHGLKITIEANKKIVNFLDVSLNLSTGTHMPFNKPNNIPLYINKKSNHPPRIISNIPQSINRRLSEISYDKAAPFYQKALDNSGYKHLLTFSSSIPTKTSISKRRNRKRDIIWYNPHLARTSPLTSGIPSLSYLTRNSPRSMCCIRSLTETPSRSATVACQTSNKTSTATTNQFYTRSCRQDLAIVE